jgi:hypothetical protein
MVAQFKIGTHCPQQPSTTDGTSPGTQVGGVPKHWASPGLQLTAPLPPAPALPALPALPPVEPPAPPVVPPLPPVDPPEPPVVPLAPELPPAPPAVPALPPAAALPLLPPVPSSFEDSPPHAEATSSDTPTSQARPFMGAGNQRRAVDTMPLALHA